jgi:hypothetical protein
MAFASDIVLVGQYNDIAGGSLDLTYSRNGGTLVPTSTPGSPTIVGGGKFFNAMQLNASGEGAFYGGADLVDSLVQTGCVSFWISFGFTGSSPGAQQIFDSNKDTGTGNRIWIALNGTSVFAYVYNSAGSAIAVISGTHSPTAGVWYHFELNYDATAGATRLFIDGAQVGSTATGTGTRTGTANILRIGTDAATTQDFSVDELILYDTVQHTGTFAPPTKELFTSDPESAIAVVGQFNDLAGGSFDLDYVRDGGAATPSATGGAPAIDGAGKFGSGLDCKSGGQDSLTYAGAGLVDALVAQGCVSFWYRPDYTGSPSVTQTLYMSSKSGGGFQNAVVVQHTSGGSLLAQTTDSAGSLVHTVSKAFSPTAGVWYHVELNFDASKGWAEIFADGVAGGSPDTSYGVRSGTADQLLLFLLESTPHVSDGSIDELLVYDAVQHVEGFTPPTQEFLISTSDVINPSFELAASGASAPYVSVPASWAESVASSSYAAATFGPPYKWVETYEVDWLSTQGGLLAFDDSDLSAMLFGTASEDPADHAYHEGYERGWSSNEDAIDELDDLGLTATSYNDGEDVAEIYGRQWPKRHKINDVARNVEWDSVPDYYELLTDIEAMAELCQLLNEVKAQYEAHRLDAGVHVAADATNAVTALSAKALANDLWDVVFDHIVNAGGTYHHADTRGSQQKSGFIVSPATTTKQLMFTTILLLAQWTAHVSWADNGGPLAIQVLELSPSPGDDVLKFAWSRFFNDDDLTGESEPQVWGSPENYETNWRQNQDALTAFSPADLTANAFRKAGAQTEAAETYDDAGDTIALPSVGVDSEAAPIEPTGNAALSATGTGFIGEVQVQSQRVGSSTFVTFATITALPAVVDLLDGTSGVRLHTVSHSAGTMNSETVWTEIQTL